jgi:predicted  nucleic acid-binding Zn-ribbon protein
LNKIRRNEVNNLITQLEEVKEHIEQVASDEQDYMDGMPENLQESEKYTKAEEAVSYLEEAAESIEDAIERLGSAIE